MSDKAYTTEAKIEAYLGGIDISEGDADVYILATQKLIEQITGRVFKADTEASARLYDGNDRQHIIIDDCVEVTKVEIGLDNWGDSLEEIEASGIDRYYLLPTNYSSLNVPIDRVGLRSRIFIKGHANHKITAKWGYSVSVPDDISFAATVLASGMYYANRGENTGAIKSEKIGEYSVSYADEKGLSDSEMAKTILNLYKRYEL